MSKLRELTLVSLLIAGFAVGCAVNTSATDQSGVIETAVASGLETALAGNVESTATVAPTATSTPEPVPTDTPTSEPTALPKPTPVPTATPTPMPTATPTPVPTATSVPLSFQLRMCEPAVFASTETCSEMTTFRQSFDEGLVVMTSSIPVEGTEYFLYIKTSDTYPEAITTGKDKMIQVNPQTFKNEKTTGLSHVDPYVFSIGLEDYQPVVDKPIVSMTIETEPVDLVALFDSFPPVPEYDVLVREASSLQGTYYAFETEVAQVLGYYTDPDAGASYPTNEYRTLSADPLNSYVLLQRDATHGRLLVGDKIRVIAEYSGTVNSTLVDNTPISVPSFWSVTHERIN
tara:strand:- start:567 stop:1604 length:1038 start_codon:yes stop_codon:yes gene_type:complete